MNLDSYINDLLYRYDCVIVPNFGGFITNKMTSKLDKDTHVFYPPTKQISFNKHLSVSDGLLVNYIASSENISFEKATEFISNSVFKWKNTLEKQALNIDQLGVLKKNDKDQLIFEPSNKINYLTSSFGLYQVEGNAMQRPQQQVKPLLLADHKKNSKTTSSFIKYAAAAAIVLTLGFTGTNFYQQNQQKKRLVHQEKALVKKIQAATFVISNPLPTIELNVSKEIQKPFHVIAGAFQFPENAVKKVAQLKKLGFEASIIGKNKWGLTQVAFNSYSDKNDAINRLYKIQKTVSKDAWLLIKK